MVADCPANCARFSLCLSNFVFIVSCKDIVTRLLDLTYLLCTFMPLLFLLRIPDMVRKIFLVAILVGTQNARLQKIICSSTIFFLDRLDSLTGGGDVGSRLQRNLPRTSRQCDWQQHSVSLSRKSRKRRQCHELHRG